MRSNYGMHESFNEYHQAFLHRMSAWRHEVLYTWQWWFGLSLSIILWSLWMSFRKRDSSLRLLSSGLFVALTSVTLDGAGLQLSFWNYLKPVTPVVPAYLPFDFALMPVVVMFIIQIFPLKNPWIVGFIFGVLTAFIGEPFFKWAGISDPVKWNHIYSVPLYMLIYFFAYKIALGNHYKKLTKGAND